MYIYPRMIFLISHSHVVFFLFEVNKCPSEQDAYFATGFSLFVFRSGPYEATTKYANV